MLRRSKLALSCLWAALLLAAPVAVEGATGEQATTIASALSLGLLLGLRHALDADHLAAITAIVSERRSLLGSSLIGGWWGLGHTLSLLVAGLIVLFLRIEIPERVAHALEFGVALMLIGLGAHALHRLARGGRAHIHAHEHGGLRHTHPHLHKSGDQIEPGTHHGLPLGVRPLLVGMVHGMAGSAALMLLVLATISSPVLGLLYIALFGLGSIGGMMIMSSLVGLPIRFTEARFHRFSLGLRALAGSFSLGFGLLMAYRIGFIEGLLF
jgi:hypothetical protein